jgi:hypothetical protein
MSSSRPIGAATTRHLFGNSPVGAASSYAQSPRALP